MKKKKLTAAELMERLRADPQFVAERAREEAARKDLETEWRVVEAPLVAELRAVGLDVDSAWDLVNTTKPYPEALSILLRHLQCQYPGPVREGIARALAVPGSRFGFDILTALYKQETEARPKDGLAVAIAAAADEDVIDDVITLAQNTQHGSSRLLLLRALERSKSPKARAALMSLGTDPDLEQEIQAILRRIKLRR